MIHTGFNSTTKWGNISVVLRKMLGNSKGLVNLSYYCYYYIIFKVSEASTIGNYVHFFK